MKEKINVSIGSKESPLVYGEWKEFKVDTDSDGDIVTKVIEHKEGDSDEKNEVKLVIQKKKDLLDLIQEGLALLNQFTKYKEQLEVDRKTLSKYVFIFDTSIKAIKYLPKLVDPKEVERKDIYEIMKIISKFSLDMTKFQKDFISSGVYLLKGLLIYGNTCLREYA